MKRERDCNCRARKTDARTSFAVAGADKPWVAVGAHYDHLGRGGHGNSLASKEEVGGIHHGADDNASGTAAVLAIAESLAKQPGRRRHVLIALWSAEEIGLVGSEIPFNRHFYEYQPPRDLAAIDADLDAVSAEIMQLLQDVHS